MYPQKYSQPPNYANPPRQPYKSAQPSTHDSQHLKDQQKPSDEGHLNWQPARPMDAMTSAPSKRERPSVHYVTVKGVVQNRREENQPL